MNTTQLSPLTLGFLSESPFNEVQQEQDYSPVVMPYQELRIAEMAGYDYIFAPTWLFDELTSYREMQEFLLNAQAIFGTDLERTIFVGVDLSVNQEVALEKFDLDWAGELLLQCRRRSLTGTTQFEFVKMLYDHSEDLQS